MSRGCPSARLPRPAAVARHETREPVPRLFRPGARSTRGSCAIARSTSSTSTTPSRAITRGCWRRAGPGRSCVTHEMGIRLVNSRCRASSGSGSTSIVCLSHAIHDGMKRLRHRLSEHRRDPLRHRSRRVTTSGDARASSRQARHPRRTAECSAWWATSRDGRARRSWYAPRAAARRNSRASAAARGRLRRSRRPRRHAGQISQELGIKDNVIFTGFQRNAIDYMGLMDVVAHTSVHPEPFGIVTLEAMSLVEAARFHHPSADRPKWWSTARPACSWMPANPSCWPTPSRSLLDDRPQAAEFGRRGYERLIQHFGIRKNLDETMAVYRNSCACPKPPERLHSSHGELFQ